MNCNYKQNPAAFANYLQSMVKLEELQKMTNDLDRELADSQRIMGEIKTIFDAIPNAQSSRQPNNTPMRHEHVSQFLEADGPKLLMPDMPVNTFDVEDLDEVIASMKKYAEELKKNCLVAEPRTNTKAKDIESLNLEEYATSLDQLNKRLANIKLNKPEEVMNRNADLEMKLAQLCQDINMFTQMVQAKTALSEHNKNWTPSQQDNNALCYDNIINKLLSDINEVAYLLKNKH